MPIRTVALAAITVDLIRDMIAREIYEDRTLDFKQVLDLREESARIDLTEDVSAFANASGGTLLYGAIEGEGIGRGRMVDIRGMHLAPDATDLQVKNLLRDNIDERIAGVETRAIPLGDGTHLYVIRVPARAAHGD